MSFLHRRNTGLCCSTASSCPIVLSQEHLHRVLRPRGFLAFDLWTRICHLEFVHISALDGWLSLVEHLHFIASCSDRGQKSHYNRWSSHAGSWHRVSVLRKLHHFQVAFWQTIDAQSEPLTCNNGSANWCGGTHNICYQIKHCIDSVEARSTTR